MKYRVEFDNQVSKRYSNFEGDIIDIAVQIVNELQDGETYKKAQYRYEGIGVKREGDKIILRTQSGEQEFDSLEAARSQAEKLPADEGYDILSLEDPIGSKSTEVIEHRPGIKEEV